MIEQFLDLSNVKIVISQIGDETRHGVPYWLNRKIWKIFIRELVSHRRISLVKHRHATDVLNHRFIHNADTVVYIRGNEGYNVQKVERKMLENCRNLIGGLRGMNKSMDFYYVDRPDVEYLSATKFIEDILRYGNNYRKLKRYLPSDLPREEIRYIIDRIAAEIC